MLKNIAELNGRKHLDYAVVARARFDPSIEGQSILEITKAKKGKPTLAKEIGMVLDLEDPADAARFRALARSADIIVESYRPGYLASLGLQVTAMDASEVGVAKARRLAEQQGVAVDFRIADIMQWEWEPERYDLVVFALPDSLTLVSSAANIRLESFLFTEEAFAEVRDHLTDDGIFILYNYYREEWLIAKLGAMLRDTFGHEPLVRAWGNRMAAFGAGPLVASLPDGIPPGSSIDPLPEIAGVAPTPATDDWPFLYLKTPFVAPYYLVALAAILIGALVSVLLATRVAATTVSCSSTHQARSSSCRSRTRWRRAPTSTVRPRSRAPGYPQGR